MQGMPEASKFLWQEGLQVGEDLKTVAGVLAFCLGTWEVGKVAFTKGAYTPLPLIFFGMLKRLYLENHIHKYQERTSGGKLRQYKQSATLLILGV
jgi:hypothetical protein